MTDRAAPDGDAKSEGAGSSDSDPEPKVSIKHFAWTLDVDSAEGFGSAKDEEHPIRAAESAAELVTASTRARGAAPEPPAAGDDTGAPEGEQTGDDG